MAISSRMTLLPAAMHRCVCLANKTPCALCCGDHCFLDDGIHVLLRPKNGETAIALALDGCVFTDRQKKCDGLFILARPGRIDLLLVELKGSHIDDAYEQLSYTIKKRSEYFDIVSHLSSVAANPRQVIQASYIITTGSQNPRVRSKLEDAYGVRPRLITVQKPSSAAPDLRAKV